MQRIQRYLLGQTLGVLGGLLALIVGILLLERLLRIADLVSRSPGKLSEAGLMLVNLVPHYLGIAIPAAFFLAVLITVSRLSRTGELVSIWGFGKSLFTISRPFMFLAILLAGALLIVSGFLQPLSRYEYRHTVAKVSQSSPETAFQEGKFVEAGNWTVWTRQVSRDSGALQDSFIVERPENGPERIIAAQTGTLKSQDGNVAQIQLDEGMGATVRPDFTLTNRIEFDALEWTPSDDAQTYRSRGKDERELTLPELWQVATSGGYSQLQLPAQVSIHDQLARFILVICMPLIAIPFGLSYGRTPPSNAVVSGLVVLIAIQQSLEFGKSMALSGAIPAWAGSWSVIAVVLTGSLVLFLRSALTMAEPPLSAMPNFDLSALFGLRYRFRRPVS